MSVLNYVERAKKDNVVFLTPDRKTASELKKELTIKAEYSSGRCFTFKDKNISIISLLEDPFSEIMEYSLVYVNWKAYKREDDVESKLVKWEKGAKEILRN